MQNSIGLTTYKTWDDYTSSKAMLYQLDEHGVDHTVHQLPKIAGMGGNAYLVCYTSPKTGLPVTVLVVPQRADVDQFAEDYFYFEGRTQEEALAGDYEMRWAEIYDQCTLLTRDL